MPTTATLPLSDLFIPSFSELINLTEATEYIYNDIDIRLNKMRVLLNGIVERDTASYVDTLSSNTAAASIEEQAAASVDGTIRDILKYTTLNDI